MNKKVLIHCPVCGQGHLVDAIPRPKKIPKILKCESERILMICTKCHGNWSYYAAFETRPPKENPKENNKRSDMRRWSYYTKTPELEIQQHNWEHYGDARGIITQ